MRKAIALILTFLLMIACAGCSKQAEQETAPDAATGSAAPESAATESTAAESAAAEPAAEESPDSLKSDGFRYEGNGFDTPEDAVLYYLAGLKKFDIDQMLGAFAWETQVAHWSLRERIVYMKGIDPVTIPNMPNSGDLLISANLEKIRGSMASYICIGLEIYLLRDNHFYNSPTMSLQFHEDAEADDYIRLFDTDRIKKLAGMTSVTFYNPDDVTQASSAPDKVRKSRQDNYVVQNHWYGADEVRDIVAVVNLGDEMIGVAPTAARYGDRWYLVSISSVTQNILGIEIYQRAIGLLPDEMQESLKYLTPVMTADLPDVSQTEIRYEGEGFNSPEEAVACYMDGLKNQNIQQMLSAFAWETQTAHYSMREQLLRTGSIYMDALVRMPSPDATYASANLHAIRYRQGSLICNTVRSYILETSAEAYKAIGMRLEISDNEALEAFLRYFDNDRAEKLKSMTNYRFFNAGDLLGERYNQTTIDRLLLTYGADELREVVGVAEMGDETLICSPLVARYGEKWYIVNCSGILFSWLNIDTYHQAFVSVKGSFEDAVQQYSR